MDLNLSTLAGLTGIPGGSQVGAIADKLLGAFGKKTDAAAQSSAINQIANTNRVTPAQAGAVISAHCDISSDRFDDLAAYCASNNGRFLSLLAEYNASHSSSPISLTSNDWQASQYTPSASMYSVGDAYSVQNGPLPASLTVAMPATLVQSAPLPASANSLAGTDFGKLANAGLNGAIDGITKEGMKTPLGKQAQLDGFKQFLNDNAAIIAGAGVVLSVPLTLLIAKALKK